MKKVQTYTPDEGELLSVFTNWAGDESTGNLPVSGKAIRELLLDRLQKPFHLWYDSESKLYRIFRSEDDCDLFKLREQYPDAGYEDLELTSFIAPSPFTIEVTAAEGSTDRFDDSNRQIRSGVQNDITKIKFHWEVYQDNEAYVDNVFVTYTIKNSTGEKPVQKRYEYGGKTHRNEEFDLFEYLVPGQNEITINFLTEHTKVVKNFNFTISVIKMTLSSEFPYYDQISIYGDCDFYMYLDSTVSNKKEIVYWVDDATSRSVIYRDTEQPVAIEGGLASLLNWNSVVRIPFDEILSDLNGSQTNQIFGKHTILFLAKTTIGSDTFCSNLLYYEFVIPDTDTTEEENLVATEYSFSDVTEVGKMPSYCFYANQYRDFGLNWAVVSNNPDKPKKQVQWSLVKKNNTNDAEEVSTSIELEANPGEMKSLLMPIDIASDDNNEYSCYLKATVLPSDNAPLTICYYPMSISKSTYTVEETAGYVFKLSAVGKQGEDANWSYGDYNTTFTNFTWDDKCGWDESDNSLRVAENAYAVINFAPFADSTIEGYETRSPILLFGRTVEIEFQFQNVGNSAEELITIGNSAYNNSGSLAIKITPNSASIFKGSTALVTTNYKSNERIKLAFIMFPNRPEAYGVDSQLLWIVNNGILERCASGADISAPANTGTIRIGAQNSNSIVKVYSIRCYDNCISYEDAFGNFAIDNANTSKILERNDVFDENNNLDYSVVSTKMDTILITGRLDLIINNRNMDTRKDINIPVLLLRRCLSNPEYDFTIKDCRIRAHGQSTLTAPIPSFKIWSDSEFKPNPGTAYSAEVNRPEDETIPNLGANDDPIHPKMYKGVFTGSDQIEKDKFYSEDNEIFQGRFAFKLGAIPAKKWVLQANYADSSGAHNGGIQRLIQEAWYSAQVDGEYVLRTEPQQFATNTGKYSKTDSTDPNQANLKWGWNHYIDDQFPYEIRVSADSVPCVIFWKKTPTSPAIFVGQYVLMDDKKSDFVYGERDIYDFSNDPFRFLKYNKKQGNKLWGNGDVIRLEQTSIDTEFADFRSATKDGVRFDQKTGDSYKWEEDFDLIYPDKDDLKTEVDETKNDGTIKPGWPTNFDLISLKFETLYNWLLETRADYQTKLNGGETDPAVLYSAFRSTASQHLDLYKIAAYYVFLLRFGLVDSMERNAQLKTYDGVHWHFEPWDMDIALGNNNDGQITFSPPIDRNTVYGTAYAFSGHNSWLYNALENWHTVATTNGNVTTYSEGFLGTNGYVNKVSEAMQRVLTYNHVIEMLDGEYSDKWCERIYNYSGHYKYIENASGNSMWYTWLLGSRATHRHWWLKQSFDYWDAEWGVGGFLDNKVYLPTDIIVSDGQQTFNKIKFIPAEETWFALSLEHAKDIVEKKRVSKNQLGYFEIRSSTSNKKPPYLLGASYLKELDLSEVVDGMSKLDLASCYDSVLGTNLKVLNLGVLKSRMDSGTYNHRFLGIAAESDGDRTDEEQVVGEFNQNNAKVFANLESFNLQGHRSIVTQANITTWLGAMNVLREFRSAGSIYERFYGIKAATYDVLLLPNTVKEITLNNSIWEQPTALTQGVPTVENDPGTWKGFSIWKQELILDLPIVNENVIGMTYDNINDKYIVNESYGINADDNHIISFYIDGILHYAKVMFARVGNSEKPILIEHSRIEQEEDGNTVVRYNPTGFGFYDNSGVVTKTTNAVLVKTVDKVSYYEIDLENAEHAAVWQAIYSNEFKQVGNDYYTDILSTVELLGTTGQNVCSYNFVKQIVTAFKQKYPSDYRTRLGRITLTMDKMKWGWESENIYPTFDDLMDLASFNNGTPGNHFKGTIMMSYDPNTTAPDSAQLTEQFTQLLTKFGATIFTQNNGALTIDYKHDHVVLTVGKRDPSSSQSVQLAVSPITIDGLLLPHYTITEGYDTVGNVKQAYKYAINATLFQLNSLSKAVWTLHAWNGSNWDLIRVGSQENSKGQSWNGVCIDYSVGLKYLEVPELANVTTATPHITDATKQRLKLTANVYVGNELSDTQSAIIDIVPKRYPQSISISCAENIGNLPPLLLTNNGGFTLSDYLNTYTLTATANYVGALENATIKEEYWSFDENSSVLEDASGWLEIQPVSRQPANLITIAITKTIDDLQHVIPIWHVIKFYNGFVKKESATLIVKKDPVIISNANNFALFNSVYYSILAQNSNWLPQIAECLRQSEVESFNGPLYLSPGLTNYSCVGDDSVTRWLFDHVPNVTAVYISTGDTSDWAVAKLVSALSYNSSKVVYKENANHNVVLDLSAMPNISEFVIDGAVEIFASSSMPRLSKICVGHATEFVDTNMVALTSVDILDKVGFSNLRLESSVPNKRWPIAASLLDDITYNAQTEKYGSMESLYISAGNGENTIGFNFKIGDPITIDQFRHIVAITKNTVDDSTICGNIFADLLYKDDYDFLYKKYRSKFANNTYTYLTINCSDYVIEFVDKFTEAMILRAIKENNQPLPAVVGINDISYKILYTKNGMSVWSILADAASSGVNFTYLSNTYSSSDVIKHMVHFPESVYINPGSSIATGDVGSSLDDYFASGSSYALRSFITPLSVHTKIDPNDSAEQLNKSCFLGGEAVRRCKYVDYGSYGAWDKDCGLGSSNRRQIMVFWRQPSYYSPAGVNNTASPPESGNFILIPNTIADNFKTRGRTSGGASSSKGQVVPNSENKYYYFPSEFDNNSTTDSLFDCTYVFNASEYTPDDDGRYKLWKRFYDAYHEHESESLQNVVTRFVSGTDDDGNPRSELKKLLVACPDDE